MPTREDLKMLQAQDLDLKVMLTKQRIREWITYFGQSGVYVSFSGGKDNTVLLHLVRELYPEVEAVFVNTGLEYPEIQRFVKSFDNVTVLYPKKTFKQVISEYGYPVISKEVAECVENAKLCMKNNGEKYIEHYYKLNGEFPTKRIEQLYGSDKISKWYDFSRYKPLKDVDFNISSRCCGVMKKYPAKKYNKDRAGITGQMASESALRTQKWLQNGCNGFDLKRPVSNPMSFWNDNDVLQYIKEANIKICPVYGDIVPEGGQMAFDGCDNKLCTTGCERTGCIYCGFGAHIEKGEGRFQRLKRTHPKQYDFCINGGAYDEDGLWKPNDKGLGMGHVFDVLNSIYGKDFIKYK